MNQNFKDKPDFKKMTYSQILDYVDREARRRLGLEAK